MKYLLDYDDTIAELTVEFNKKMNDLLCRHEKQMNRFHLDGKPKTCYETAWEDLKEITDTNIEREIIIIESKFEREKIVIESAYEREKRIIRAKFERQNSRLERNQVTDSFLMSNFLFVSK